MFPDSRGPRELDPTPPPSSGGDQDQFFSTAYYFDRRQFFGNAYRCVCVCVRARVRACVRAYIDVMPVDIYAFAPTRPSTLAFRGRVDIV